MQRRHLSPLIREYLVRYPPPHNHAFGVVPPEPPRTVNLTPIQARHQRGQEAIERVQRRFANRPAAALLRRGLETREAVESSAIEGTHTAVADLMALEAVAEPGEQDSREGRNYVHALELALDRARQHGRAALTPALIVDIHANLMDDTGYTERCGQAPGEWRQQTVWLGGGDIARSRFNPPPASDVPRCLDSLAKFLTAPDDLYPMAMPARIAVAHAYFETIHPFADGNGRVGRILMAALMAADRMEPVFLGPFLNARRSDYFERLQAVQQTWSSDAWRAWIGFISDGLAVAGDDLLAALEQLEAVRARWGKRLTDVRRDAAAWRALDLLVERPVVTVRSLANAIGVSRPAAEQALRVLAHNGIVSLGSRLSKTGGRPATTYVAAEALDIYRGPFGDLVLDEPEDERK